MRLFHVTDRQNLASILKRGLLPGHSPLGIDTSRGYAQEATFFERRPITPKPGPLAYLRLDVDDAALFRFADISPTDAQGKPTPPTWRGAWGVVPPGAITGLVSPPRSDAAHLARYIEGAEQALAQTDLPHVLVDATRAYAWRAVRQFQALTRATPWRAQLTLDHDITWSFTKQSVYDLFLDAVEHHVREMHKALGNDPDWPACWAGQAAWFTAGRNAASAALAYQDVAA